MKGRRVIISGGGTAGHLYPALAVSMMLKEREPNIAITFIGSNRDIEKNIMKHHKADFISLKIEGIKGKGLRSIRSLFLLPFAFLRSLAILIRLKPRLVIGVGGYSSGPIVLLASWIRIPTLLMEQNLQPGFTNRMLLRWVRKAVVSFKDSVPYFKGKGIFMGNPTRREFSDLSPKKRNSRLTLLIFGGSQGSYFLNKSITDSLPYFGEEKDNLTIFHQTGKKDQNWVNKKYSQNQFNNVTVAPFFYDMASYYQKADLVISRAGATTVAELIAAQKASLLIPFSKATDNHQVLNARELEKVKGAEIILEEEFTPHGFKSKILDFMKNKKKIDQMENGLVVLKTESAAIKISDLCFELMNKQH